MDTETLFGIADACARLSIKRTQFYKLVAAGKLDARKMGAKTVVTGSSVQRFIDSLPGMNQRAA
jgi:excisionase family DNA binding protein